MWAQSTITYAPQSRPGKALPSCLLCLFVSLLLTLPRLTSAATALEFNGSNNYVTFGVAPGLASSNFTLEVWFKRKGPGAFANTGTGGFQDGVPLIAKGRGEADNSPLDMNYFLGIVGSSNVLAADFEEGATGPSPGLNHPVFGVTPIVSNVWYHAAVTYDGSTWRLYLNGILESQSTVGRPPRWDSIQHASLATALDSTGTPAGFFNGVLDEARIWNYARTAQQISNSMSLQIQAMPGLVGRWGFEEPSGNITTNTATNGLHGTLIGNPLRVAGYPFIIEPTVSITAPASNASFPAPATLSLAATASDPDGTVTNVAFFAGSNPLGNATASPFNLDWTDPPLGYYLLTAIATDNAGNTGTSAPVAITIQNPVVALTNPVQNARFIGPADILLQAETSDANGSITLVEFYVNSTKLGEATVSPFEFLWEDAAHGDYSLTAVATDIGGIMNTSVPVAILITTNTPPSVTLLTPTNNTTAYLPTNLLLTASVSDIDGTVSKVEFFAGTNKLSEAIFSPWSFTWTNPAPALYSLRAIATDDRGLQSTSAVVSVLVANASITRGPYLQMGGTNRAIVRWRTNIGTDGRVRYGTDPQNLGDFADEPGLSTEHVVAITNLLPGTKYYYSIGTSNGPLAIDTNLFFVTSPPTGADVPTRLWVLGDPGTRDNNQRAVRDAYYNFSTNRPADLLLLLGDNAYNNGTDAEYQAALFDMYPTVLRNTFMWPTIGNHDTAQATTVSPSLPYFQMFSLPTAAECGGIASGTEKYYSFDYGPIHFICLDSQTSTRTTGSAMLNWLLTDLNSTTQPWLIAFWHHSTYTKRGGHDSDSDIESIQLRQFVNPIMEAAGVDLVMSGHSHSYERSFLINGHYGLSATLSQTNLIDAGNGRIDGNGPYLKPANLAANAGAIYCVAGSSGQVSGGSGSHPANFLNLNTLGSLVLDITGNRLDLKFVASNGTVQDYFTLLKGDQATPPATPATLTATAMATNQIRLAWSNTATNEKGFRIERSLDGVNFSPLATLGANITAYTNVALLYGTTYYYRVSSTNTAGDSAWSAVASATTPAAFPPVFVTQPAHQLVNIGGSATFSVIVTGTPPITYQWRFNSNNIANATNSSYTISNVQDIHAGTYSVTVTGYVVTNSANATLTVNHPPLAPARSFARQPFVPGKVPIADLLGTDPDGDTVTLLTAGPATAQGGAVATRGLWLFYTPPLGFTNGDSFVYAVSDGRGGTATNLVAVNIQTNNSTSGNFSSHLLPGGITRLTFRGIPARAYSIQFSENSGTNNWQSLVTTNADAFGLYTYEDIPPKDAPPRIYRSTPAN